MTDFAFQFFDTLESTSAMPESTLRGVNMYTSHEGLLLPYEEALTRPVANYGAVPGSSSGSKYTYAIQCVFTRFRVQVLQLWCPFLVDR